MHTTDDTAALRAEIERLRDEVAYLRAELSGSGSDADALANEIAFHASVTPTSARFLGALLRAERVSIAHLRRLVPYAPICSDNLLLVHISRTRSQLVAAGAPLPVIERCRGNFFVLTPEGRAWLEARIGPQWREARHETLSR